LKKLTYPQTHQKIDNLAKKYSLALTENQRSQIAILSGQLENWISPLTKIIAKNQDSNLKDLLKKPLINQLCQDLFSKIPQDEWFYLLNPKSPSNLPNLYSPLFKQWLELQPITEKIKLSQSTLTASEAKIGRLLLSKQNLICSRDEIAQSLWGNNWMEKYSDWCIDTQIHNLKAKLYSSWQLKTVRNRGYLLTKSSSSLPSKTPTNSVPGTRPTKAYLDYMNNPKNPRQTIKDLLKALDNSSFAPKLKSVLKTNHHPAILVINSYSYDNVDALHGYTKNILKTPIPIYFTNSDDRALEIHRHQAQKLNLNHIVTLYDDIRYSRLQSNSFSVVINDFRLNFNTTHKQNQLAMKNTHRVLKDKGLVLISVVVDDRYESSRFGTNQQKAPLNHHKPWTFIAQENLQRNCFTVPYYKELFQNANFKVIKQFDTKAGKSWQPAFRRFLLKKI
ncbi:helix-turn-helix domain-containing protein, partial [Patescibacteria group bacterium]|nr:helix-turn-helix domain-containing protein [Patescibacteria group bacterium]